ncbi:hypothetical protein DOY81_011270 [Sarcophaga bullata]|nr:hypothetical protein DOY81_011270 [Sarcophaga bullata]
MADIAYPAGCKPLTEDLGTDELIRRLKTLSNALQAMGQDDSICQEYIPLSLHLADYNFLHHQSRDVQLLVACCIADVLRVYAPEAPYKDQEHIKSIFLFFIKQLYGLKDPKDPSFKRYFYLLENLAYVKSFNMCFELEDSQEIFRELFSMMFKIVNEEHSIKVKNFMIDIMSPLINEADNFANEILDIILINIVEPRKSQNKFAYELAEKLIVKTADSLESILKIFFNQVLVLDKIERNYEICQKIYDLIYELHIICPNILCSILPQLECKLKSSNEQERLKAVSLLARMFSEKDSKLSIKHAALLRMFLGRFCDISVSIRVKCVQSSMHFLLNQPHLREDIISSLKARQHDSDENVRYEVVMAIVETAKREFTIVCESEELLDFVRERTLDKKFKIRKEAMWGLAFIYKKAICEPNDLSEDCKKSIEWIKNKIMHGYYMPTLEDRLQVERLLITSLVPYKLPPVERMKQLYHLMGTFDDNATKAFIELQKNQMKTRKTVLEWVKLHKTKDMTPSLQSQLNVKQSIICKLLADPLKASEYLTKFSTNLRKDPTLFRYMEIILKRDVSCKECADTMSLLLKKLGTPIMTNLYYQTVKMLIERIASVMIDKESVGILIGLIEECMRGGEMAREIGLPPNEAGEQGLKLLTALSYLFSPHFFTDKTLRHMISLLSYDEDYAAPLILKSMTHLGRYKPLISVDPNILEELVPVCKDFALEGTPKQAKHAVRCIFVNTQTMINGGTECENTPKMIHPVFNDIMDNLRLTLKPNCAKQRTKVVTMGHIAYNMPKAFADKIKNMIARRIVKELLIQPVPEDRVCTKIEGDWCEQEELPADTLCKLDGLKTMARWLLGLKDDEASAKKTFRMLIAFIHHGGDLLNHKRMFAAESSWFRLAAACAMLKVCEQKGVGDQYTAEQFYSLSQLMCDPVPQVREMFARKLHKGLNKGLPSNCLPLDFMGFYALAGFETDKKLLDLKRQFLDADINRRREYLKTIQTTNPDISSEQRLHLLPDFLLAFAIPILVHDPKFTNHEDRNQLKQMEKCLRFILDSLMAKTEAFSYSFYRNLIELMKDHYVITPHEDNKAYNLKMWACCDLANYVICSKMGQCDLTPNKTFNIPIKLPPMYFQEPPNDAVGFLPNTKIYIPYDMFSLITTLGPAKKLTNALKPTTSGSQSTIKTNADKRPASDHLTIDQHSLENASLFDSVTDDTSDPNPKRTRTNAMRAGKT